MEKILVKYQPVQRLTKRQKAVKTIKWQLVILSVLLNLLLAHQIYTVRCGVNGQVVGWFTKKSTCGEMAEAKFDQLELARVNFLQTNSDILK